MRWAGSPRMIFIPRSYPIFYVISIKKFVKSLEKDFFDEGSF